MPDFSFQKGERLKSIKVISLLFKEGHSFIAYPLRFIWMNRPHPENEFPAQFALSVPKRSFSKAADRNVLRRRIREAYRLHKHELYEVLPTKDNEQLAIMALYIGKEPLPYHDIEKGMLKAVRKFRTLSEKT